LRATILLGTLKREGLSNTETLCEFLVDRMEQRGVTCEIVKLVNHSIPPGTYSDMGDNDEWPGLLTKLVASEIVVIATPIWWSSQSSLIQRVIERLDELHDMILAGKGSPFDGKVGGIVITGDSDGAQQIIGNLCNFFNGIGLLIPPYCTLSVLWDRQRKDASPSKEELLAKYESDHLKTAERMIQQLSRYAAR
jgi:multimeric flavodoxin WrbA